MAANTDNTTIAKTIKLNEKTRREVEQSPSWKYGLYEWSEIKIRLQQQGKNCKTIYYHNEYSMHY